MSWSKWAHMPQLQSPHSRVQAPWRKAPFNERPSTAKIKFKNRLWGDVEAETAVRRPNRTWKKWLFFFASSSTNMYETSKLSAWMLWELGLYRPWWLLWLLCGSACPVCWWGFGKLAHEIITLQTQQIFPFLPHDHVYPVDQKWGGEENKNRDGWGHC